MDGLDPLDDTLGNAPLNPTLMTVYMQTLQQGDEQGQDFGQPEDGQGGEQPDQDDEEADGAGQKPDFGRGQPDFGGDESPDFGRGEADFGKSLDFGVVEDVPMVYTLD